MTTKETTAYILKPFRSPKSKKLKAAVIFVPRLSHFDIENERSSTNEFRVRPWLRSTIRSHRIVLIYQTGFLHTLLDFDIHMDRTHIHSKYRKTRRSAQLPVRYHVFKRCAHIGAQRCCACLGHRNLRAIRKGSQPRVDQVLLDWGRPPAYAPDIHSLYRNHVDF